MLNFKSFQILYDTLRNQYLSIFFFFFTFQIFVVFAIVAVLQIESLFVDCSPVGKRGCKKFNSRKQPKYLQLGLFGPSNYPSQPFVPSFSNCYCPSPGAQPHRFAQLHPKCPWCPKAPPHKLHAYSLNQPGLLDGLLPNVG